ncbi:hypothetical protein SAFG77S_04910 [Streptomyces afghaniensis]
MPGTRSMSPKEQKITPGREAISSALSMTSSGVTQTGQPGPWINSTCSGSSWSMPCRMIEWVCPPHTSIRAHGRVAVARISSSSRRASSGSLNSSMYFTPFRLLRRLLPGVAELLLQQPQFLEQLQRGQGRLLVQALEREADVHDDVLAHPHLGHVLQTRLFLHSAEVDQPGERIRAVVDGHDLAGHCQTHGSLLLS